MPRKPEYQYFLDIHHGRIQDPDPKNLETTATPQEIGWWKQQQFRKAMKHARAGEATEVELIYLAKKGYYYKNTPSEYKKKSEPLWDKRRRAQAGVATIPDLIILAQAGYYYPTTPQEYRRKTLPKDSD